ncbi:biotin--[acetyl-CoA-carboxylase] ligase [Paenarthrobacter sp. Z7-10]|uniref:biotin--[acetyl-CoA-carboxylase] ligase n=1 Tax=Paenarthrobacter sp. Z7-10 TaxID=2787635 RepID=UPI0022A9998F|nr:biotin--[acetyl-CoA-carboxylase] ligase [Paenarthrobacter sp. Z7-10]MCZ2402904.1 biotin--[acetyl-CoA-carboxylase] ligase [Paenarthrobacter sp. Z7-10]
MTPDPEPLDVGVLRGVLLQPAGQFARVDLVRRTGSTNADLVAAVSSPASELWPDLSMLCAEEQSSGRGRMDRVWNAPPGSSVIVSVLLRPNAHGRNLAPDACAWMSMLAALGLIDALDVAAGISAELKWPNDVLVAGRKVSGILAHLVPVNSGAGAGYGTAVVLGTGINVSQTSPQLPVSTATSLALQNADTLDRNILLVAYMQRFAALYRSFCDGGGSPRLPLWEGKSLLQLVSARMATLGCAVRVELPGGRMLHGEAIGLDAHGSLLVRDGAGSTHPVSAGDVVHLRRQQPDGTVAYA